MTAKEQVNLVAGIAIGVMIGIFIGINSGHKQQCHKLGGVITYDGDCYIEALR